jgi:spore cortex biosynthesis protein YabQ
MISSFIEQQWSAFLASIITGFIMGGFMCVTSDLKKVVIKNCFLKGFIDVICWLILCVILIGVITAYNSGELRMYIFLGFFSGIGIYFSTIHWVALKFGNYILYHAQKGLKKVILTWEKLVDRNCRKR